MKINGTPQPDRHSKLGAKPLGTAGAGKGNSGCMPALVTIAILGTGWLSMLLTGSGWIA